MGIKKKGDYLDCYTCPHHYKHYDRKGRVTAHWCNARNGKLRKRFRGYCKFVMKGGDDE